MTNLILNTDSYKMSHFLQYPEGTTHVYSYIESRGGRYPKTLFFGLQMFLKEYLTKPITKEDIDEAEDVSRLHGEPFNRKGWERLLKEYDGYLPLEIKALPEGSLVDTYNVLVSVVNTDPAYFWLTSYIETALLRGVWYPTTVATLSYYCKKEILDAIELTSDDPNQIMFKLHDFGARGASSLETASIGGCSHLVNFMGSDTVSGIMAARKYYGAEMAGFSIPAAEHSTITAWGKEREVEAYRNMLNKFAKPGSLVAVVSDSYDLEHAVKEIWGKTLKNDVITSGATVVIRPDSGNPFTVPIDVVKWLSESFGYTTNSKGYKVLNNVRVIQGDGINPATIPTILGNLISSGFAVDNLAFGMGGGLLQQVDRDTLKFAMKASAVKVDGMWTGINKEPKTDTGKTSKKGMFSVVRNNNTWETVPRNTDVVDQLRTVFYNGKLKNETTFEQVRLNAAS